MNYPISLKFLQKYIDKNKINYDGNPSRISLLLNFVTIVERKDMVYNLSVKDISLKEKK